MKASNTVIAALLMAIVSLAYADNVKLRNPPGSAPSDYDLTYFDGTSWWLSWSGLYRGTWFNTEDFFGSPINWSNGETEMWFYHHASYPWDTSDVYFEVHNGDQSAPTDELDQTQTTATHYSPTTVAYDPTITTE